MQTLKTTILTGWPESKQETEINIRHYWQIRDELTVQNGIVFRGSRVVIPKLLQQEMLTKIHISHLGPEANTRKAKDVMYWPGMSSQIKDHHSNCSLCNEYLDKQQKQPLISHPIPVRPWSRLGMDLFQYQQNDYLITVDYYSDYWELNQLQENTKSKAIIECCKRNFARHDIPDVIVHDGGPQLDSEEFRKFSTEWQFEISTSDPYHSQSNGKAESAVKIAKKIVKKMQARERRPMDGHPRLEKYTDQRDWK